MTTKSGHESDLFFCWPLQTLGAVLPLVLRCSKRKRNQLNRRVDEEANEHARRQNLHIRTFLLVQVPRAAHAEEVADVSESIHHQHDKIDDLKNLHLIIMLLAR